MATMRYDTSRMSAVATNAYRCRGQPDSVTDYAYPPMLRGNVMLSMTSLHYVCFYPGLDITYSSSHEIMVEPGGPDHRECDLDGPL